VRAMVIKSVMVRLALAGLIATSYIIDDDA
jgi:hypothetical protein